METTIELHKKQEFFNTQKIETFDSFNSRTGWFEWPEANKYVKHMVIFETDNYIFALKNGKFRTDAGHEEIECDSLQECFDRLWDEFLKYEI